MIHRRLKIGRWAIDFFFVVTDYGIDEILDSMAVCGASDDILERVEDIMLDDDDNCGFTFANPRLKRAVSVVGPTTGGDEFLDTLVHEVHHIAVAIAESLGIDLDSEPPAYYSGDTVRSLADVVCKLGCGHCRSSAQ